MLVRLQLSLFILSHLFELKLLKSLFVIHMRFVCLAEMLLLCLFHQLKLVIPQIVLELLLLDAVKFVSLREGLCSKLIFFLLDLVFEDVIEHVLLCLLLLCSSDLFFFVRTCLLEDEVFPLNGSSELVLSSNLSKRDLLLSFEERLELELRQGHVSVVHAE